jgi:hypothetical protein
MSIPGKIVRTLNLKSAVTIIPIAAAAMSTLTVYLTLFCGSSDDPRSISMAGASDSGAIFFNLSLVLYLPLWGIVLLLYHSESWVLAHGKSDVDIWSPPFTLTNYNGYDVRYWHRVIAVINVISYAMLVSLPVDEFAEMHDFSAGGYFLSLYLHLTLTVLFPIRETSKREWEGNQLIRTFVLGASSLAGFGLVLGICSANHLFELFEISGSGLQGVYIVTFAVEFRRTFSSVSILVERTVKREPEDGIVQLQYTEPPERPTKMRMRGEKLRF